MVKPLQETSDRICNEESLNRSQGQILLSPLAPNIESPMFSSNSDSSAQIGLTQKKKKLRSDGGVPVARVNAVPGFRSLARNRSTRRLRDLPSLLRSPTLFEALHMEMGKLLLFVEKMKTSIMAPPLLLPRTALSALTLNLEVPSCEFFGFWKFFLCLVKRKGHFETRSFLCAMI
jgi:hypothetical protein